MMNSLAALCLAAIALPSVGAFAQANVIENQSAVVYVDTNNGSDANSSSFSASAAMSQPLKTLQAAVAKALVNNSQGIGTRVLISPGEYREAIDLSNISAPSEAPIILEAAQAGSVTISGSDLLTHWYQGSSNRSIYTHSWNYNFGECSIPSGWPRSIQGIVRRREMIFVNGTSLTQVLSMSGMREGTFYVNESANSIHVWPPRGTNMGSAKVEAAVRSHTLDVTGRHNIVFRGLVLQHAASCINEDGGRVFGSSNIVFDNVQVKWNNWGGLGISSSSNITVKNSIATHNGGVGFSGFHDRNVFYESDESDDNNWRGAQGGLLDWGMGGLKLSGAHTATVNNFRARNNQAQGLWFDTDNKNITISNVHLTGNKVANLQLEVNEGPISVTNSTFCSGTIGMNILTSEHITATGNVFYNNGGTGNLHAQLFLGGRRGGRPVTDWETHRYYLLRTSNITLRNNVFEDSGGGQKLFSTYLIGNDWNQFASNLTASGNRWHDPTSRDKFVVPINRQVDLNGWQNATRTDYSSSWQSDAGAAAACGN